VAVSGAAWFDCHKEIKMPYIQGFVAAVPAANREAYIEHARKAADWFRANGASRCVEAWGDDVPAGNVTDFQRAVAAKPDEVIVFSWMEFPDKTTAQDAEQKMMSDLLMMNMQMPFDGARMIYGGFESLFVAE
jgi:uncharacterized protein YbaA (DUF1428 family)